MKPFLWSIKMKKCKKCNIEKIYSEFREQKGMRDGLSGQCKICVSKRQKENRERNFSHYAEYDRKRDKSPDRKLQHRNTQIKYIAEHPKRNIAVTLSKNALQSGLLKKHPCLVCGEIVVEAHHPDYDLPLSVVWLCNFHHRKVHKEHRNIVQDNSPYFIGRKK